MGGKELEVIDNPHDGYSVEYLRQFEVGQNLYPATAANLDTSQLDNQVLSQLRQVCSFVSIQIMRKVCTVAIIVNMTPIGL